MFSHVAGEMQVLGFWHSSTSGAILKKKATNNETKNKLSSKRLYKKFHTIAFGDAYMVNILNNPNISKIHRTSSEGHYNGVFLLERRPNRVIEMACFNSKLQ